MKMGKEIFKIDRTDSGAEFLKIDALDSRYPVRTFFTARSGGRSEGNFESLNMGFATGDRRESVEENRRKIFDFIGEDDYCETVPYQVHRAEIGWIRSGDGEWILSGGGSPENIAWEERQEEEKGKQNFFSGYRCADHRCAQCDSHQPACRLHTGMAV